MRPRWTSPLDWQKLSDISTETVLLEVTSEQNSRIAQVNSMSQNITRITKRARRIVKEQARKMARARVQRMAGVGVGAQRMTKKMIREVRVTVNGTNCSLLIVRSTVQPTMRGYLLSGRMEEWLLEIRRIQRGPSFQPNQHGLDRILSVHPASQDAAQSYKDVE
jgi:hypothetical protein